MKCQQVGNRIEITPTMNPFDVRSNNNFVKGLEDARFHGFDVPKRMIWSVLDTPETRELLVARGYIVLIGDRSHAIMLADLEKFDEILKSI